MNKPCEINETLKEDWAQPFVRKGFGGNVQNNIIIFCTSFVFVQMLSHALLFNRNKDINDYTTKVNDYTTKVNDYTNNI
jgi:hypothetical protein